jgi:Concanavalin A-like lectin/glucanases superfamily
VRISPLKANLGAATNPVGGTVTIDGASLATPATLDTLVGFQHTLSAPAQQVIDGVVYQFTGWSDGGAREHTISVPGTSTYTANYAPLNTTNYALVFDGNDLASCSPANYPQAALTIEGWVRPAASIGESTIVAQASTTAGWSLDLKNGLPIFSVIDGAGVVRSIQSSAALVVDAWAHLAATYDGSTATLFVNGQIVASGSVGALAPASTLLVGSAGSTRGYSGQIDDLRISTTVRYTTPFTPQVAHGLDENTVVLYRVDEGSGQILIDTAGTCSAQRGSTAADDLADPLWVGSSVPRNGPSQHRIYLPLVVK